MKAVVALSEPHARLAYWNMFVPRTRPDSLAAILKSDEPLSTELHARQKTFFYSRFVVENVR